MTVLLSRIVPREQMVVVHAPLAEVEWPGAVEHVENTLPDGVPLILAPVTSGKSLLDSIEEAGPLPVSVGPLVYELDQAGPYRAGAAALSEVPPPIRPDGW